MRGIFGANEIEMQNLARIMNLIIGHIPHLFSL
jgi:hypothetical protein